MSCCGQRREALERAGTVTPERVLRAQHELRAASAPGRATPPRRSAAVLAYLARKAAR